MLNIFLLDSAPRQAKLMLLFYLLCDLLHSFPEDHMEKVGSLTVNPDGCKISLGPTDVCFEFNLF